MSCEFERIEFIRRLTRSSPAGLLRDIGDDCAVFDPGRLHRLLVTTDLLVEDVHFRRSWIGARLLGRKACVVNVSDLAAMGARPLACQLALAFPADFPEADFRNLVSGFVASAESFGMALVGGDLSSSSAVVLSVTAMGCVESGEPVLRSGAQPGDQLFVAGRLGYARLGLNYLTEHSDLGFNRVEDEVGLRRIVKEDFACDWVLSHLLPDALVEVGQALQQTGLATSMIDVSDGLASDTMHLLEESRVAAELAAESLPIPGGLDYDSGLDYVLNGGEDYALAFTVNPARRNEVAAMWKPEWPRPIRVGTIAEGIPQLTLRRAGRCEILEANGFDHFK